jgi:4-alpha-glucanotransferase
LRHLARLYGVQTEYRNVAGQRCAASTETLLAMLQALGAPLARVDEAADAVRHARSTLARRTMPPVAVAWDGLGSCRLTIRLPQADDAYACQWVLESGQGLQQTGALSQLPTIAQRHVEGETYLVKRLPLQQPDGRPLPWGYHRLTFHSGRALGQHTLVIAAPRTAWHPEPAAEGRTWGVFAPLYALRRQQGSGAGDFTDLETLMAFVSELGGGLAATLPLLATAWELGGDPSPYSPSTRLFWNELYLDVTRIAEFAACGEAQRLAASDAWRHEQQRLAQLPRVDYPAVMALKRPVLECLAAWFGAQGSAARRDALQQFCRRVPDAVEFARFRAAGERRGATWPHWPQALRQGSIAEDDYDPAVFHYHLYTQWQVHEQLHHLSELARRRHMLWYLDFPLGVNADGYDVWKYRDVFACGAAAGAPPDPFFSRGQNWGFPPQHPQRQREGGYFYFIQCLRRHLQFARLLRIDHVMGLYRMYWIPHGLGAQQGAYVRYPADELLAIVVLESHRHGALIVGENLGTVPPAVDEALHRHELWGMYVLQYAARPDDEPPLSPPGRGEVASLNTHDMPTFATFWNALDVDDRLDLGLLDAAGAQRERDRRATLRQRLRALLSAQSCWPPDEAAPEAIIARDQAPDAATAGDLPVPPGPALAGDTHAALRGCLQYLARSDAPVVLVNLEDLWLETRPQNTPGTTHQRHNWQNRTRYTLEALQQLPAVRDVLHDVAQQRSTRRDR